MAAPPLTGYNNNVRHRGRIFHIQTEDSGVGSPRIWTHLFADGGRIVKSTRTDYSEHIGRPDQNDVVRGLMKDQHKAMFVALRSGQLDEAIGFDDEAPPVSILGGARSEEFGPESGSASIRMAVDMKSGAPSAGDEAPVSVKPAAASTAPAERSSYAAPRPANIFAAAPSGPSLFGDVPLDEKSLDDAILSYLADAPAKKD